MNNKIINIPPILLTVTLTTNILNCNVTSLAGPTGMTMTQPYLLIRRVVVSNDTNAAATFTLYKGLTGANTSGTELYKGVSIPANSVFVDNCLMRLDAADFIVGGSNTASALTIRFEGEIGVSG